MGEAKQRRKAQSMLMVDPQMAMERLGTTTTGKPGILMMLSAELISAAVRDGTLWAKVEAEEATAERHLWRCAYKTWELIQSHETTPWPCMLCERGYYGLSMLSVIGVTTDPREGLIPTKLAVMTLVCASCDVSSEETRRRIEQIHRPTHH